MIEQIQQFFSFCGANAQWIQIGTISVFCCILLVMVLLSDHITARYLSKAIEKLLAKAHPQWGAAVQTHHVVARLAHIIPAMVINLALPIFMTLGISDHIVDVITRLISIYVLSILSAVLFALLNTGQDIYKQYTISTKLPINSYIQVAKIVILLIVGILVLSILLNKSPMVLLTSIGALTAVLILVFRDSLLGFVASIQLALYDMVRIGDWIEIPKHSADGNVLDISLTTVKIQNFDNTISTVPTYDLLSSGVKNWRGMSESGGRRIKRAIPIDMEDITHCDTNRREHLKTTYPELTPIIDTLPDHITNEALYRRYVEHHLRQHPDVAQKGFTLLVRQLDPSENGLPIEIYCFTNTTDWKSYETIQADILAHLMAALPHFGLKPYQRSSDYDRSPQ